VWKETRSVDDKPRSRRPGHRGHGVDREQRTSPIQPAVPSPQNRQASPSDGRGTATAERHPSWITRTVRVGGKTVCALVSVVVLAVTGYAWNFIGRLSDVTTVDVLGGDAGGSEPLDGSRDILLVGMDSRTDAQGNPLSEHVLNDVLHVGGDGDTENTDTIILLHIPQDTEEAVAISIPRDSYVEIPGFGKHKINSAYQRAKLEKKQHLKKEGGHDKQELELRSSEAGAQKLVQTVELLTGRTIDNYASVNLLGFYEITKAIGGVEVCLKEDTEDSNTGLDLSAGHHTLKGKKALGFVRQRHNIKGYGMGRVKRQQAFLAGIASKILSEEVLASPSKLRDLTDSIKDSIVLDAEWDIFEFAQHLRGLAGGDIKFYTVPIVSKSLQTPYDGIAVEVDPQEVRQFIANQTEDDETTTSTSPAPSEDSQKNSDITVNVFNTTNTAELAGRVADALVGEGFNKGVVSNAPPRKNTVVRHAPDDKDRAQQVAQALGGNVQISPDSNLTSGHVSVLLAGDYDPAQLPTGEGGAAGQSDTTPGENGDEQPSTPNQHTDGDGGDGSQQSETGAITADGIPCVY